MKLVIVFDLDAGNGAGPLPRVRIDEAKLAEMLNGDKGGEIRERVIEALDYATYVRTDLLAYVSQASWGLVE